MKLLSTLFALLLCACAGAASAQSETFRVGAMQVERHGDAGAGASGAPLILIPGLASGAWVWQDTVAQFAGRRTIYVATLAGFDGQPAAGDAPFADALAALDALIAQRKLSRPVVIGHSLGGTLALAYAAAHPGVLGGVATVDGLPVFPGTENLPAAQRAQMGQNMGRQVAAPEAFAGQQQKYMRAIGVLDAAKADALAQRTARSDPGSVGRYVADVMALDLRPQLAAIDVPVLAIVPYSEADSAARGITLDAKSGYYQALLAGVKTLEVAPVSPARHFAMIDQPAQVRAALERFVAQAR